MIRRVSEIGRKVARNSKTTMIILFDDRLIEWNNRAVPQYTRQLLTHQS